MLSIESIDRELIKDDAALRKTYLKLRIEAGGDEDWDGITYVDGLMYRVPVPVREAKRDNGFAPDFKGVDKETTLECSKCSKVCGSTAGLKAHERSCKALDIDN